MPLAILLMVPREGDWAHNVVMFVTMMFKIAIPFLIVGAAFGLTRLGCWALDWYKERRQAKENQRFSAKFDKTYGIEDTGKRVTYRAQEVRRWQGLKCVDTTPSVYPTSHRRILRPGSTGDLHFGAKSVSRQRG